MRLQAFLLIAVPFLCFAQAPPAVSVSPEVDQALRARVTKFLEYQGQGNFSKAFDFVAADSRNYYFAAPKGKDLSFTVDHIDYSAEFSMATVSSMMKRQVMLAGHPVELPQVLISQWKIEKGEWFWYHDPSKEVTPTILGDLPAGAAAAADPSAIPKDVSQKAALAAATKITIKAAIDKQFISFHPGKESTEQVIFTNSNGGVVRVYVEVRGARDRITVEPLDFFANPQAETPVKIKYKPVEGPIAETSVRFTVEPFGSVYVLPVRMERESVTAKQPPPAQ